MEKSLQIDLKSLSKLAREFGENLAEGLAKEGQMLKALPTFITTLPTGSETGNYLVVDLGGSNLRVGRVTLSGGGKFSLHREKWQLPDEVKDATRGEILFDFVAGRIKHYLEECWEGERPTQLGFTFSYPVRQEGLAHGVLLQWSKALNCHDVIGKDVVSLLQYALSKVGLDSLRIAALLNDTVGTMMAHSYIDPATKIGVIVGTGTNAAYLESISAISKLARSSINAIGNSQSPQAMVINVEWGAYGDGQEEALLPLTDIDHQLDSCSNNPGKQRFEKLVSGMYLGEIARRIMEANGLLGRQGEEGNEPFALSTTDIAKMAETKDVGQVRGILAAKLPSVTKLTDGQIMRAKELCLLVVERSARLCAAVLIGLYRAIGSPKDRTVAAFDGAVYVNFPGYAAMLEKFAREIDATHSMDFRAGKGESIIGAAITMAALHK